MLLFLNEVFIACTIPYFVHLKLFMVTARMQFCSDVEKNVLPCAISRDDVGRAWLWVIKAKFDAEFCKWLIRPIQVKLIQNFTTSAWRSGKFNGDRKKFHRKKKGNSRWNEERPHQKKLCVLDRTRFYYILTTSFRFRRLILEP